MSVREGSYPTPHPVTGVLIWIGAGTGAAALVAGVIALDGPAFILPALCLVLIFGIAALWHTPTGLTAAAFAIAPLGIVQAEIAGVTINLPEALIIALFLKELLRFLVQGERASAALPLAPLAVYIATAVLSIGTGLWNGNGAVRVIQDFRQFTEYIAFYLLVLHRVATRRQMAAVLAAFAGGILLIAIHGILQRYTAMGIPIEQVVSDLVYHQGIRSGSFYGATPLGALMVLGLGPALGLLLFTRRRLLQGLLLAMAGTMVTAAVFTNTRASWLGIALLLTLLFAGIRKRPIVIATAVAAALIFTAALGPMVAQRMAKLEISRSERSLVERIQYYTTAWHIFRANPVFGLGWGCHYDIKEILVNGRYIEDKQPFRPNAPKPEQATVHSAYLQMLVKGGLLTLAGFFVFLLDWVRRVVAAWRVRSRNERDYNLFLGVVAALVGYLFHSGFENFFRWPVMSQAFWMLMALSTLMAYRLCRHGQLDRPRETAEA